MISFTVKPDGKDQYEVVSTTRDIVRWEAGKKDRTFAKLMDGLRMADMYELAYYASVRSGLFSGSLDSFNDAVDLEFDTLDQDPTGEDR